MERLTDVAPAKWIPYFDDVDSIIFLAPISAFDQALAEDSTFNRLVRTFFLPPSLLLPLRTPPSPHFIQLFSYSRSRPQADSLDLWSALVSNKVLQKTNLILFLNKIDIMQAKLASGIRLADFLPAYGLRPNDFDSASRCTVSFPSSLPFIFSRKSY